MNHSTHINQYLSILSRILQCILFNVYFIIFYHHFISLVQFFFFFFSKTHEIPLWPISKRHYNISYMYIFMYINIYKIYIQRERERQREGKDYLFNNFCFCLIKINFGNKRAILIDDTQLIEDIFLICISKLTKTEIN